MKTFCRREFLNNPVSASTGTVVAYCGPDPWTAGETLTFLEVGDCHTKARLHKTSLESPRQFLDKMILLRNVIDEFIGNLEEKEKPEPADKHSLNCVCSVCLKEAVRTLDIEAGRLG